MAKPARGGAPKGRGEIVEYPDNQGVTAALNSLAKMFSKGEYTAIIQEPISGNLYLSFPQNPGHDNDPKYSIHPKQVSIIRDNLISYLGNPDNPDNKFALFKEMFDAKSNIVMNSIVKQNNIIQANFRGGEATEEEATIWNSIAGKKRNEPLTPSEEAKFKKFVSENFDRILGKDLQNIGNLRKIANIEVVPIAPNYDNVHTEARAVHYARQQTGEKIFNLGMANKEGTPPGCCAGCRKEFEILERKEIKIHRSADFPNNKPKRDYRPSPGIDKHYYHEFKNLGIKIADGGRDVDQEAVRDLRANLVAADEGKDNNSEGQHQSDFGEDSPRTAEARAKASALEESMEKIEAESEAKARNAAAAAAADDWEDMHLKHHEKATIPLLAEEKIKDIIFKENESYIELLTEFAEKARVQAMQDLSDKQQIPANVAQPDASAKESGAADNKAQAMPPVEFMPEADHGVDHGKNLTTLMDKIRLGELSDPNNPTVVLLERKAMGKNMGMPDVIFISKILEHNANPENKDNQIVLSDEIKQSNIYKDAETYNIAKANGVGVIGAEGSNLEHSKADGEELYNRDRVKAMGDVITSVQSMGYKVVMTVGAEHVANLQNRVKENEVAPAKAAIKEEVVNVKPDVLAAAKLIGASVKHQVVTSSQDSKTSAAPPSHAPGKLQEGQQQTRS